MKYDLIFTFDLCICRAYCIWWRIRPSWVQLRSSKDLCQRSFGWVLTQSYCLSSSSSCERTLATCLRKRRKVNIINQSNRFSRTDAMQRYIAWRQSWSNVSECFRILILKGATAGGTASLFTFVFQRNHSTVCNRFVRRFYSCSTRFCWLGMAKPQSRFNSASAWLNV